MAENIKRHITHIKSKVANQKPTSSQLLEGEVAVNYAKDKEFLSIKNESGDVVTFSSDNYYTEQKLGSGFTGENSGNTVTKVIEDNEKVISSALNALNEEISNLDETYVTLDTNQTISGEKTFSETIKIEDDMNVSGTARFNGDAKIDGHLYANGTTDLYETQLHSTLQMRGNDISDVGTLIVNGTTQLIGGLNMSGNDIKNVQSITITGTTRTNGNLETHNIKPMTGDTYNIGTKSSDPTKNKYYKTIYVRNVNDIPVSDFAQTSAVTEVNNTLTAHTADTSVHIQSGGEVIYNLTNVSGDAGGTNISASWSGNCSGITELTDGMNIQIKIPVAGNGYGVVISINGGEKHKCILNASTSLTTHYPQGAIVRLVYDANQSGAFYTGSTTTVTTQGVWKVSDYDSNTNTVGYLLGYNLITFKVDAPTYRYVMLFTKDETTLTPVNSANGVTAGTKTLTTEEFDPFGGIYYKNSKTNVASGSTLATGTVWTQYALDLRYSFNTTSTLIVQQAVYMVVVPQSNGKVKLHTNPISQTLPTTEDGLVYIYLGQAYNTTNLYLAAEHPLYQFKNGKLMSYTADDNVDSALSDTSVNPVQNKVITNALAFKKVTNPSDSSKVGIVNTLSEYYDTNIGKGAVIEGDGVSSSFIIKANGSHSHAEGYATKAIGDNSHAEGLNTTASGNNSHAEGENTTASGEASHAEGTGTTASGDYSHAEGTGTTASGDYSHAEGFGTTASGYYSHAEGENTTASGEASHAEGDGTTASGYCSHAEGDGTVASSQSSHAEGSNTQANGYASHAEGDGTVASSQSSHAEGSNTQANGYASHAEGLSTVASGQSSHAEGNSTTASGSASHAEGYITTASGSYSHAEGFGTITNNQSEHASGRYNVSSSASTSFGNSGNTLFSVGNGSGSNNRHNAFEIRQNGDIYIVKDNTDVKLQDVISQCIYVTYSELKTLKQQNKLKEGTKYRIKDFVTTTTQANTQSANHPFDIIVTATSSNTLSETAMAAKQGNDTYFSGSNLSAWDIKYCFENDTNRFGWADSTNGKGVIYYMKDEFSNEAPYDFKNIQFKRWKCTSVSATTSGVPESLVESMSGISVGHYHLHTGSSYTMNSIKVTPNSGDFKFFYTFSLCGNGEEGDSATVIDGSLKAYGEDMYKNNVIREYMPTDDSTYYMLNNIVFKPIKDDTYDDCTCNVFGKNCREMTLGFAWTIYNSFGNGCYDYYFGNGCGNNSFGNRCESNYFGNDCGNNSFGSGCYGNSFGESCDSNSFENDCYRNSFGNDCNNNSFGNNCNSNSFGESCDSNSFGNVCGNNSFGNRCESNYFGNVCGNNSFGNRCESNYFGNKCSNNSFGETCRANSFGNWCSGNTTQDVFEYNSFGNKCCNNSMENDNSGIFFGNNCWNNSIDDSCYNITLGDSCQFITFNDSNGVSNVNVEGGNRNITLNSSGGNNITIAQGVNNSNTRKTINHTNRTGKTTYQNSNSTVINV